MTKPDKHSQLIHDLRTKCGGCEGLCEDAASALEELCAERLEYRAALRYCAGAPGSFGLRARKALPPPESEKP